MESIWVVSLIILWCVVLVNLLLTLRLVRSHRLAQNLQEQFAERETLPELSVGSPAPDFNAKLLTGKSVRLASYAGQAVAFIFISPHCGSCRRKLPMLVKLSKHAKERANVDFVLVSDSGSSETYNWINAIHEEDGVEISLPVLTAPFTSSDFQKIYNPRGMTPYYCLISEQGYVLSRDPLGMGEWPNLQREWEGSATRRPTSRMYT